MKKLLTCACALIATTLTQAQTAPAMVAVAGGTFVMGSDKNPNEQPAHKVTVHNFSIGKTEVTVAEYKAFCKATHRKMPEKPFFGWNDKQPMVAVSYDDALAYCDWLSKALHKTFRLPTEAEWEYAAAGGSASHNNEYSGGATGIQVGWNDDNSNGAPNDVATKTPNELGLFDMTGNVWEWCSDWYGPYTAADATDPAGPASGAGHVVRGGSWASAATEGRVHGRYVFLLSDGRSNDTGFRVVCTE